MLQLTAAALFVNGAFWADTLFGGSAYFDNFAESHVLFDFEYFIFYFFLREGIRNEYRAVFRFDDSLSVRAEARNDPDVISVFDLFKNLPFSLSGLPLKSEFQSCYGYVDELLKPVHQQIVDDKQQRAADG